MSKNYSGTIINNKIKDTLGMISLVHHLVTWFVAGESSVHSVRAVEVNKQC